VVFGMTSFTLLLAVDTAVVGRVSPSAQGVAGIGDVALLVVALTLAGLNVGCQVISARRFGEGDNRGAGAVLDNSLVLALIVGIVFTTLGVLTAGSMSRLLFGTQELRELGQPFLAVKMLGVFPFILAAAYRGFFAGVGRTVHFLIGSGLRVAANIFLDFALVFGMFGFPELGLQGAAIAGTVALFVELAYYIPVIFLPSFRTTFGLMKLGNLSWKICRGIIKLSFASGIRNLVSLSCYLVFFRIAESIGTVDFAVSNISRTVFNLVFMPVLGIGVAVSSLVSRNIGEGRPEEAEKNTWRGIALAIGVVGIMYAALQAFAPFIARVFTEDQAVAYVAVETFRLASFFLLMAPAGVIFSCALEGAGNVIYILIVETLCCVTYLYAAWLFGIQWNAGIVGAYNAEFAYFLLFCAVTGVRFLRRDWFHTKV